MTQPPEPLNDREFFASVDELMLALKTIMALPLKQMADALPTYEAEEALNPDPEGAGIWIPLVGHYLAASEHLRRAIQSVNDDVPDDLASLFRPEP